ncbi:ABC transporter permease subunit [Gemmata sp. JC717]|uniref:ABC transporter permease n=1 Tax=Gemmata algarum TaxID=2975278 RepID=UPI0021BB2CA8|nr:ABC transporter permease subunit [Gemmata algarum]MDY3554122.1 ABC transporter permease subunit [Gemmata algarum]
MNTTNESAAQSLHPAPQSSLPSAFRAWCVLVVQSFQRHWRMRQMGLVSAGLLALVVTWVGFATRNGAWDVTQLRARRTVTTMIGPRPLATQEAERQSLGARYQVLFEGAEVNVQPPYELPNPLNPTEDALTTLLLSIPQAALRSEPLRESWGFMNYSRFAVLLVFMGFVLPLFTLSYASGAFGTDRETRSLVWVMTRPIPRGGIYLAKFLGTLPWCVSFGLGGFALVSLAGGATGRAAFALYWPAAAAGTVAFAALFHLVGALFRRPVVIGLVYVFFFETVVAALPGSLKLLSLTFYARSLMYNEAVAAGHPGEMLPAITAQAVSSETAWAVLLAAPVAITLLGMWLFSRSEYRDDV